jgi:type 1 glutamine amidotransferase
MKSALVVQGGWEGHEPEKVSRILGDVLEENGFEVEISATLDSYRDLEKLKELDLIVPCWTMGSIEPDQLRPLLEAVRCGTGIAGLHGGMGDSFRQETEYQHMCGGQWVAHPGGLVTYTVHIVDPEHPLTKGIKDFTVTSEQYYLHVDPADFVLTTTNFGDVVMPVSWTKMWGKGRVFYSSLGHNKEVVKQVEILELMKRGMLWAAEKKG